MIHDEVMSIILKIWCKTPNSTIIGLVHASAWTSDPHVIPILLAKWDITCGSDVHARCSSPLTFTQGHKKVRARTCAHAGTHPCTHMYMCMHACVHVHVHMCACVCVCMHTRGVHALSCLLAIYPHFWGKSEKLRHFVSKRSAQAPTSLRQNVGVFHFFPKNEDILLFGWKADPHDCGCGCVAPKGHRVGIELFIQRQWRPQNGHLGGQRKRQPPKCPF